MTPEQWQRIDKLFHAALEHQPEERNTYLHEACPDSPEILSEVTRLLDCHEDSVTFLDIPTSLNAQLASLSDSAEGQRIGSYNVLRVIASGGMGTVYEAVQDNPKRRVALKLMRHGVASPSALRRFEHESQVLGRLRHPGVAQIFEAGTHGHGRDAVPYFAMEYIDGLNLAQYVREKNPSPEQRLDHLARICDAVHHGHQKGVIHRDLKPANILIDSSGQPKVIDFGVARAVDSDIQATTQQTDMGQLIGTIPYMSPEQVMGDPTELDARSDVYSLGVVGYELITGRLPYDIRRKSIPEAVRVIRDEDPSSAGTIDSAFRGDIETIFAKALEKDRDRRYQSAFDLAMDIRHYLEDEPIAARPANTFYQIRKFSKRNKALVTGLVIAFICLLAGTIGTGWQAIKATHARDDAEKARLAEKNKAEEARNEAARAQAVRRFVQTMLASADPRQAHGQDVTVGEALDNAAIQLEAGSLADQPLVEAAVRHTIGETYLSLGRLEDAERQLDKSIAIDIEVLGNEHRDVLATMDLLATVFRRQGRLDEALTAQQQSLETRRRTVGEEDPAFLSNMHNLAVVQKDRGKFDEAESLHRSALEARRRILGPEHPDTLISMSSLAVVLKHMERFDEAEILNRNALEIQRRLLGNEHPDVLCTQSNLAGVLIHEKKYEEALQILTSTMETSKTVLGNGHPQSLRMANMLAVIHRHLGDLDKAEALYTETLETQRRVLPPDHPNTTQTMHNLAILHMTKGDFPKAEQRLREVWEIRQRTLGPQHPHTLSTMRNLVQALIRQDKIDEAEPLARQVLAACSETLGQGHRHTRSSTNDLARILMKQENWLEAESLLAPLCPDDPTPNTDTHRLYKDHAHCLLELGSYERSRQQLRHAQNILNQSRSPNPEEVKEITRLLDQLEQVQTRARNTP